MLLIIRRHRFMLLSYYYLLTITKDTLNRKLTHITLLTLISQLQNNTVYNFIHYE